MKFLKHWYVYLARGIFAIILGLLLVVEKAHWNAIQYMGMFWLSIGLTSIAWARSRGRDIRWARWSMVAGILGVLAGLIALARPIVAEFFATWVIVALIGALSIITGLAHIFGGFRAEPENGSHWSWGSYLVGGVQVVLGAIIVIYPFEPTPAARLMVVGWCLITGVLLILDAQRLRTRASSNAEDDLA
jgi:uncharacterized membrane protein HdeD (DUF308 family)